MLKDTSVIAKITEQDKKRLTEIAEEAGQTVSCYLRNVIKKIITEAQKNGK